MLNVHEAHSIKPNSREINMVVDEMTLSHRKKAIRPKQPRARRGWLWMYSNHVRQSNDGCYFNFLETNFDIGNDE